MILFSMFLVRLIRDRRNPIKLEHEMLLDLPIGRHRITFAIELSQREMPLRVEMADVPGSNTKVQLVSGK